MTQTIRRPFWWHLNLRKEREINRVRRALILSVDRMNETMAHNSELRYKPNTENVDFIIFLV